MRTLRALAVRTRAQRSDTQSSPVERSLERVQSEKRREYLRRALALGAVSALPWRFGPALAAATAARVIIVGGGLAGLAAAHMLAQVGIRARVFEGSPRVGGRCWTERRAFDDGQIAERGGELIDTSHDAIRTLAASFALPLDDLLETEPKGSEAAWMFDGAPYPLDIAAADMAQMLTRLDADARCLEMYLPTFRRHTPAQRALDQLSAADWIATRVDGGLKSRFGRLVANAYMEELGGDLAEISAVTVVALLMATPHDTFSPYEESDQRYHIRGGNDQLVRMLAERVEAQIEMGTRLTALVRNDRGQVRLAFARDQARQDAIADRVILALPFSLLRDVDLERSAFRARKLRAIRELEMGRNTKLQLQFRERAWLRANGNGETRIEGSYLTSWDVTRAQSGEAGILNFFSGGTLAVRAGDGTPEERARDAIVDVERIYPGIGALWNGKVIRNAWDRNPWSRGSYSLLKPSQYTSFHGIEWEPEGTVYFAGEHTSEASSGYLNGAIESGQRAATEVLASLGVKISRNMQRAA
ncbi:MAG TPA: FAD-dependent oxidoreductase [Casimicrobiaceae bacterium]